MLSYRDRLRALGNVDTLELRRLKCDLLMMYKIIHKLICIEFDEFFAINNYTSTRGHSFKLVKPVCNNNCRQFAFACRCIDAWNGLPSQVVCASSVYCFKHELSQINFNKYLQYDIN